MKQKLLFFAIVEAIAFVVALLVGITWLMIGIGLVMLGEYAYFTVYESNMSKAYFEKQMTVSRKMLLWHTIFCVATIILAAVTGVLDGYDLTEEVQTGGTYEYNAVHQDGIVWWYLIIFLIARGALQFYIEKAIHENIKLAERRELNNK